MDLDGQDANEAVSSWANELANLESQRLNSAGLQALPLKVCSCGPLGMYHIGKTPKDLQRFSFNRVVLATNFDFANVRAMEVGELDEDSWMSPEGKLYFCVICLLRLFHVTKNAATLRGREMVMVFPYVFEDPRNPLTHWALVNRRQQHRYIVHRNVRQGSAVVPGQALLSSAGESQAPSATATDICDDETYCNSLQHNMSASNKTCAETVRQEWLKLSFKQREEMLRFEDPVIFERALKNVTALFSSTCTGVQIAKRCCGLPLLSSLEFEQNEAGLKMTKISSNILEDGMAFFSTLLQMCPGLFTGKLRPRNNPADWPALFETPAQEAWELQQRVAELIEQKLWVLTDVPAREQQGSFGGKLLPSSRSGKGKRRAKNNAKKHSACFDESSQVPLQESTKLAAMPVAHVGNASPAGEAPAGTSTKDGNVGVTVNQCQQDACSDPLEVTEPGTLQEHDAPGSIIEQATRESTLAEKLPANHIPHLDELQSFKQQPPALELPEYALAQLMLQNQLFAQQLGTAQIRESSSQVPVECMLGA